MIEFLAAMMKKGIKTRAATRAFTINGQAFDAGSLLITRRNNETIGDFDNVVQSTARSLGRKIFTSTTGFVDKGADFGSGDVNYLKPPKIALLGGAQTSALNLGEVWHYFEQQIHYPVSMIGTDYFTSVDLWKYTVLIVPEGYYRLFDDPLLETIQRWVSDGGRLIVMGGGLNSFADKKGFGLKEYATETRRRKLKRKIKRSKKKKAL